MFIIKESPGKFTNFFVPSMLVILSPVLPYFIQNLINTILLTSNIVLNVDILIQSLLVMFISQLVGILVIYVIIMPLMRIKDVTKSALTIKKSGNTILLFCLTVSILIISNFIITSIFNVFNLIPQSGYSGILLNSTQANNPLNVIIYYLPFIIGAPIFEEFLYRRTLIPLLEKRGMTSFTAIIIISIIFAVAHLPNDIINGNIYGGIIHVVGVFYISISLGISYILTRNILFPIIIHSLINLISFSGPLFQVMDNLVLNLIYNITIVIIFAVGIFFLIYCIWNLIRRTPKKWIKSIRNRKIRSVKLGTLIFLLIGISSAFLPVIIEIISVIAFNLSNNIYSYISLLLISQFLVISITLWLSKHAKIEDEIKLEYGM